MTLLFTFAPMATQVCLKRAPSPERPPATTIDSSSAELTPRTSSDPLTLSPSERMRTPRSPGRAASFFAIVCPAANESPGPATSIDVITRSVFSNFATVTEIDLSRTVVPWISPALEQPITMDRG